MDEYYSDNNSFDSKNNNYRKYQDQNGNKRSRKYKQEFEDPNISET